MNFLHGLTIWCQGKQIAPHRALLNLVFEYLEHLKEEV